MAEKIGKGGTKKVSSNAYEETLRKNSPVPKSKAENPRLCGPGRVQQARKSGYHKDSVDTEGHKYVEPATGSQLHTDGSNDGITLDRLLKAAKSKKQVPAT